MRNNRNRGPQHGYPRRNGPPQQFYNINNPYLHDFDFLHYNDPRLYNHPEDEPVRWTRHERRHEPNMSTRPSPMLSHRPHNSHGRPIQRNMEGRWPEDPRNRESNRNYGRQFPEYREPYPPHRDGAGRNRDERFYGAMEPEERRLWRDIDDEYTDH